MEIYLIQLILAALRVEDGGLVPVLEEVTCCDEAVSSVVARTAGYQDAGPSRQRMDAED